VHVCSDIKFWDFTQCIWVYRIVTALIFCAASGSAVRKKKSESGVVSG
jgi:hypothetical protein